MRLAYYSGCTLKTSATGFEISGLASAKALGIELVELPRWNCCGTVHSLTRDDVIHYIAPVTNLIRVEEMKRQEKVDDARLVTLCEMCYNTLKRANSALKDDVEKMKKLREIMDRDEPYGYGVEVVHYLEVVKSLGWRNVKKRVVRPLEGLKVAPYYGCLLLRPRGIGIDDHDNPRVLEELSSTLGAEVVDIPLKARCCGSYHTVYEKEIATSLSRRIVDQAFGLGADVIALACPLCEYNLVRGEGPSRGGQSSFPRVPIVYFTQLMALAFGLEEEAAGLSGNLSDSRPALNKIHLEGEK